LWHRISTSFLLRFIFLRVFYCQDIKPAWDRLASNHKENINLLIGFVDCEGNGADLCDRHGVVGVPSYRYGEDSTSLEIYRAGQTYETFSAFVFERLLRCSLKNLEACVDVAWGELWKLLGITKEQLDSIFPDSLRTKDKMVREEVVKLQKVLNVLLLKDGLLSSVSQDVLTGFGDFLAVIKESYAKLVTAVNNEL